MTQQQQFTHFCRRAVGIAPVEPDGQRLSLLGH